MKKTMKRGFTLVELIIVIAILAILLTIMIGNINPLVMINRGYDAQRKKDIARLKVAFEEYYNDKGCYPSQELVNNLNCDTNGFAPWMATWPCDPSGVKYKIVVEDSDCPHWFKLMANLQDQKDKDIPDNWYSWGYPENIRIGDETIKATEVNYGTSSSNVSWYEFSLPPECDTSFKQCYTLPGPGRCNALPLGINHYDAYVQQDCLPQCQVACCHDGVVCGW
jgi:prepilin-type N-terminal cleavage/methylation domain-containing protein